MFTLFAIPDSTATISGAAAQVTAYVPQFLPVIYFALGLTVVVGTILLVKRGLSRSTSKMLRR